MSARFEPFLHAMDEAAFPKLQEAIRSHRAIAFVGAGLSARVGYGDWRGLLDKLGKAMSKHQGDAQQLPKWTGKLDDLAWVAEIYRKRLDVGEYEKLLRKQFAPNRRKDVALDLFAKLDFRHIITTNYDTAIERALKKRRKTPQVVRWSVETEVKTLMESLSETPDDPHLVYLHGRGDDPTNIVLSERDYVSTYAKSDFTVRRLFAIFSMRSVVFIGFSLSDPDVTAIFRQVNSIHREPRHYALLAVEPDEPHDAVEAARERFKEKYGIVPIFFRIARGEKDPFRRFVEILGHLHAGPPARRRARVAIAHNRRHNEKWTDSTEFRETRDPSDPQKGRFGGQATRDNYTLAATVNEHRRGSGWFRIALTVSGTSSAPVKGKVRFFVHDSFPRTEYSVTARNGKALLELGAYGAFTVGALVDDDRTPLELDLAKDKLTNDKHVPKKFRQR